MHSRARDCVLNQPYPEAGCDADCENLLEYVLVGSDNEADVINIMDTDPVDDAQEFNRVDPMPDHLDSRK